MTTSERLSPVEAIMWRAGVDARLRMTVGSLTLLDRPIEQEAVLERIAAAVAAVPRLRSRLDDPSRRGARPAWIDDGTFDPGGTCGP